MESTALVRRSPLLSRSSIRDRALMLFDASLYTRNDEHGRHRQNILFSRLRLCERDVYSAVGKGMDMYTLRSIGKHLDAYLRSNMQRDHCHAMAAYERHRSLGCAPPQIMKKLGYAPYNKPCPACPLGKSFPVSLGGLETLPMLQASPAKCG